MIPIQIQQLLVQEVNDMRPSKKNKVILVIAIALLYLLYQLANNISIVESPDNSIIVGEYKERYWLQEVDENDSVVRIKFFDEMNNLALDADYCKPKNQNGIVKRISYFNPITLELLYDENSESLILSHIYGGYLHK